MRFFRADYRHLKDYLDLRCALYQEVMEIAGVIADTADEMRFRIGADCAAVLLNPDMYVYLAYDGEEAAGLFKMEYTDMEGALKGKGLYFRALYVKPQFRGKGSCLRGFHSAFLELSRNLGIIRSQVRIVSRNRRVVALAARFGFTPIAIVMERNDVHIGRPTGSAASAAVHGTRRSFVGGGSTASAERSQLSSDARSDGQPSPAAVLIHT